MAASISAAPFRKSFLISRRQVTRYVTARRTVLFGPGFPIAAGGYTILKPLIRLGLRATHVCESRPPEGVFAWSDTTLVSPDEVSVLVAQYGRVINARCLDIGKERVEQVHRSVFGYGLAVDPRTAGRYLRKSIENSRHDARIFEKPPQDGVDPKYVYQRPLQNQYSLRLFEEIRLPYVGACMAVCMVRLKVRDRRFGAMPSLSELASFQNGGLYAVANAVPIELMFSAEEIARIGRFAVAMGLDCGELDIIRDFDEGKLYVIDANKTAAGPSIAMDRRDMRRYLDAYTDAVAQLLASFRLG